MEAANALTVAFGGIRRGTEEVRRVYLVATGDTEATTRAAAADPEVQRALSQSNQHDIRRAAYRAIRGLLVAIEIPRDEADRWIDLLPAPGPPKS